MARRLHSAVAHGRRCSSGVAAVAVGGCEAPQSCATRHSAWGQAAERPQAARQLRSCLGLGGELWKQSWRHLCYRL